MHGFRKPGRRFGREFNQRKGFNKRMELIKRVKKKVSEKLSQKDWFIIQGVRSLDELNETISGISSRLFEWFKINFPEFSVENNESACKIIASFGAKEDFDEKKLSEIIGVEKAKELMEVASKSYGEKFDEETKKAIKQLAQSITSIIEARKKMEEYVKEFASEYLKNLSYLTDPLLAGRLVLKAGGLEKLAKMPASTIQVMGAEKSLFMHLQHGKKPPKHGIIFQSSIVSSAPLKERGKTARALATKLAIAAKADFYTKHFIADKLKEELEKRLKEIKEKGNA